jgi:transitional endoplasmic reticulum ATPase
MRFIKIFFFAINFLFFYKKSYPENKDQIVRYDWSFVPDFFRQGFSSLKNIINSESKADVNQADVKQYNFSLMSDVVLEDEREKINHLLKSVDSTAWQLDKFGYSQDALKTRKEASELAIYLREISREMVMRGQKHRTTRMIYNTVSNIFSSASSTIVSFTLAVLATKLLIELYRDFVSKKNVFDASKIKSEFIGQDDLKKKVSEIIRNASAEDSTTGILLYGPPGTGKTEFAKYIASSMEIPYKVIMPSDIFGKYVGESEQNLKNIMDNAFQSIESSGKPYLLIIDECELLLGERGKGYPSEETIKNMFLQYFEGFYSTRGLVIVGITNFYDNIDKAFLRPGRFTHQFKMDMPSLEDKKKIFDYYKKKYQVSLVPEITVQEIENVLKQLTSAEIAYFFQYHKKKKMTHEMFQERAKQYLAQKNQYFNNRLPAKKSQKEFIGQDDLKKKVSEIIHNAPAEDSTTGILLYGPPGTGKTEFAKYIASSMEIPYKVVMPSDIFGKYMGESENNLKNIMHNAFESIESSGKPYLLIIDECEQLLGQRGKGRSTEETIKNMLLQSFEGFYSTPGLVILGITNFYDNIDKAFLRPGRFTHQFKMDMPSLEDKRKMFDYYKEKYQVRLEDTISTLEINMILAQLTPAEITYFFQYCKGKVMTKKMMKDRSQDFSHNRLN